MVKNDLTRTRGFPWTCRFPSLEHKDQRLPRDFLGWADLGSIGPDLRHHLGRLARGLGQSSCPKRSLAACSAMKSFQGGLPTAVLGVALEFLITFVATAVYYVASRKLSFPDRQAVLWGVLYGIAIYFFMNFIVVPLSAAPKFDHTWALQGERFRRTYVLYRTTDGTRGSPLLAREC